MQKWRTKWDAKIFKGVSPFDDGGTLELIEGFPEGADIPVFPESPPDFSPGLDTELKKMAQQSIDTFINVLHQLFFPVSYNTG